jgi:superfamily II DNA helicase RecQ
MNYDIVLQELLERHFGTDEFVSGQKEIISHILSGKDVLAFVHRESDRSLCYKLPALVIEGIVLVVSRQNQINETNDLLPSVNINGSLPPDHIQKRIQEIIDGKYKIVYVGPEQFQNRSFLFALNKIPVSLIVIDNAECISHYGYNFNPQYTNIPKAIKDLDTHPNILSLAGGCTKKTRDDILKRLNMDLAEIITMDVSCNFSLDVMSVSSDKEKIDILSDLIRKQEGQGIIYTNTRDRAIKICDLLKLIDLDVSAYHGGMNRDRRNEAEKNFDSQKLRIIVATSFLIPKLKTPVSYIIHYYMHERLERYFDQVIGQNNQSVKCVFLYFPSDREFHQSNIERGTVSLTEIWRISDMLKLHWKKAPTKLEPKSKKEHNTENKNEWLNKHFMSLNPESRKELLKLRNVYENLNERDKNFYSPEEYNRYLESEHWKAFTNNLLDEYEQCYICENKVEHIHHLSYRNLGKEEKDDVVALCSKCHCYIHPDNQMTKKMFLERQEADKKQLSFFKDEAIIDNLVIIPHEQIESETGLDRNKLLLAIVEMQNAGMLEIMPDCTISARAKLLVSQSQLGSYTDGAIKHSLIKWLSEKDEGEIDVNLLSLSKELDSSPDELENSFLALDYAKCLSFRPMRKGMAFRMIDLDVTLSEDIFEKLKASRYESLRLIENYVNTKQCRWKFLGEHLLDNSSNECGKCDNCTSTHEEKPKSNEHITGLKVFPEKDKVPIVILYCAEKADGLVGRRDMMKILLGQKSKRILRYGFDHIDEFGSLSKMPKKEVLNHIDNLIERGCLQVSSLFFPMIQLTDVGRKRLEKIRLG